jgi:hypothetical protein
MNNYLSRDHQHNERRTWFVIALTLITMAVEISSGILPATAQSGQFICYKTGQIYLLTTSVMCNGPKRRASSE